MLAVLQDVPQGDRTYAESLFPISVAYQLDYHPPMLDYNDYRMHQRPGEAVAEAFVLDSWSEQNDTASVCFRRMWTCSSNAKYTDLSSLNGRQVNP